MKPAGTNTAGPGPRAVALLLLAVCGAARALPLGDPIVQIDEQFYLLVGGRMLHGALPYVDIWDRKPIGLFLLFAAFRAPGGSGVVTYQIAGLLSVWLTALILFRLARRVAPWGGALAAAILYVVWLNLAGGEAGQAPVYYNLPVAAAIATILRAHDRRAPGRNSYLRPGIAAMLLFGVAMQIKYSAVFEGVFAGIALLALARSHGARVTTLILNAGLWVGCAILPTALAAAFYADIGHFPEWWFANFGSILLRRPEDHDVVMGRIGIMTALVLPLLLCIPLRRWLGCRPDGEAARFDMRFLDGWAASALLGVVLFGTWFNHYALPLFSPFAVTAAPLWRSRRGGRAWLVLLILVGIVVGQRAILHHQRTRGDGQVLAAAVAALRGMHGCPFVYDGFTALYDAANACLPTNHPFSAHLQARNEMGATGIDEVAEVRRIMALRPERVMTMEPIYEGENPATRAVVYAILKREYRPLFRYTGGHHNLLVYGRADTIPAGMGMAVLPRP